MLGLWVFWGYCKVGYAYFSGLELSCEENEGDPFGGALIKGHDT